MAKKEDKIPHLTYRLTDSRKQLIERLRELCDRVYPETGERIHGALTTAQILDWALEDFELKLKDMDE